MLRILVCLSFITVFAFSGCREERVEKVAVPTTPAAIPAKRTIVFFGDSLTAGQGLSREQAFPAVIEQKIQREQLPFQVLNAGVSGETTAGGLRRLDWVLRDAVHVFVLGLGANDGLRGFDLGETKRNLAAIVDLVRSKYPQAVIVLLGMKMPPNFGPDYTTRFENLYREIASEKRLPLVPFLLDGVGGITAMNQSDGVHPTAEGQKRMAENVWAVLRPLLR